MLDFRLETFLAVYEEKSYTRAALRLGMTQPGASQHIKALEERFGTDLFEIQGRRLIPTDAGESLYRYAAYVRAEGRRVEAKISLGCRAPLRLGATRSIGEFVMPQVLSRHLSRMPDARLSLVVENTEHLLAQLSAGTMDAAFVEGNFDRSAYASRTVCRDELVAVSSPDAPWCGTVRGLEDLLGCRLFLREKGSGSRDVLEAALLGDNLRLTDFERVLEVGNIGAIKHMVGNGLGVAFLYRCSVQDELDAGRLVCLNLGNFLVRHDYSCVRLKDAAPLPGMEEVLEDFARSVDSA